MENFSREEIEEKKKAIFDAMGKRGQKNILKKGYEEIKKGEGISYGHLHIAKKKTKGAIIPLGYAEGYSRSLFKKAKVLIKGKFYPIMGAISMNQMMVDIGNDDVNVGDEVVLIGRQKEKEITLKELADIRKTITYEIAISFNGRLPIVYKE